MLGPPVMILPRFTIVAFCGPFARTHTEETFVRYCLLKDSCQKGDSPLSKVPQKPPPKITGQHRDDTIPISGAHPSVAIRAGLSIA